MAEQQCKDCKHLSYCTQGQELVRINKDANCNASAVKLRLLKALEDPKFLENAAIIALASMMDNPIPRFHDYKALVETIAMVKKNFHPERTDVRIEQSCKSEFIRRMEVVMGKVPEEEEAPVGTVTDFRKKKGEKRAKDG